MPNLDTGWILKYASAGYAAATGEMNISVLNESYCRLSGAGRCFGDTIIQNGVRCSIGHFAAGGQPARGVSNTGVLNRGDWIAQCSGAWDFPRLYVAYYVTAYVQFSGEQVGGYNGFYRGSDGYAGPFRAQVALAVPVRSAVPADNLSDVVNTRDSDTQNTVSWINGNQSGDKTNYIDRSVDDGAWAQLSSVNGAVTSYVDRSTSVNHKYRYRVRSGWGGVFTEYAESNATYNTPIATGRPHCARNADNSVTVSFDNHALTATATELWRTQEPLDDESWALARTQDGANVIEIDDIPGGGTYYYRTRNIRDELASEFSETSDPIVTIMPPAAPSLIAPSSSAVVASSQEAIEFVWVHNPLDGSVQSEAELRYRVDEGPQTTIKIDGEDSTYTLENSFAVNSTITWSVRTKGADPSFGPFASSRMFAIYQSPMVALTSPGAAPIATLPILVSWTYTDPSGSQQQGTVQIRSTSGAVLYSTTFQGAQTETEITSSDYLPANNQQYIIRLSVRSTTSLTSQTEVIITTDYLEPPTAQTSVVVDRQRGSVSLAIFEREEEDLPATMSLGIMRRRPDGSLLTLADKVPSGTAVADVYPPLDMPLTYVFVAYAATGVASMVDETVVIPSKMTAYINFSDGFRKVAKIALETKWNKSLTHAREIIETAGLAKEDAYPLVIYGAGTRRNGLIKGTAIRDDDALGGLIQYGRISDIDELSEWTGDVILRLPYEQPFCATVTAPQDFSTIDLSSVSISYERVRAYGLAI